MKKIIILLLFILSQNTYAQEFTPDWASLNARKTPEWYGNAKFGIFIHWGVYSVPAWATDSYADGFGSNYAEWYWQRLNATNLKIHKDFTEFHKRVYGQEFQYRDFAKQFRAEMFKPAFWASVLKNSGAKYVVLTSKHHDGFALWQAPDTKDWNAVENGPGRDLLGELTKAVSDSGLRMGYYYSLYEWYHPLYQSNVGRYVDEHMIPQIKDLVAKYQPDVLWTDGEWEQTADTWKSKDIIAWLYNHPSVKNKIVINDRWGSDTKGLYGSFNTSEYGQGRKNKDKPWEECRGIGQSFGYNRNENLADYATTKELVHELIRVVATGGNFLLNIGPAADGTIPVIMQERLKEIGDWLKINGEAIYDTKGLGNEYSLKDSSVFFTKKGRDIYATLTHWKPYVEIGPLSKLPNKINLLGSKQPVRFSKNGRNIKIYMPYLAPEQYCGNNGWVLKLTYN